jgi:hypothetical protein
MQRTRAWVLVIGILFLLAWVASTVVNLARQTAESTLGPVNQLSTQVSSILNPTPTIIPDPVTIIHEVRSLARLETIQYSLEKIIRAEENQGPLGFLFGDRLLFVGHGIVIAGVDLGKMEDDSAFFEPDGTLVVVLPEPEVFVATLDNDKSYVYDRETGLLSRGDINLETAARQAAEAQILEGALEDGILEQARVNAESYLLRLLASLGFTDVVFESPEN